MATRIFGSSIKRREDPKLITGEAQYLEDIQRFLQIALQLCMNR